LFDVDMLGLRWFSGKSLDLLLGYIAIHAPLRAS
jgi:hypothetical protein